MAFPLTQNNWPQALAYIGAIQFIPILGYLVIRGWRFDIARRVGSNQAQALPDWRNAREHLKQGALLFLVGQLHYLPLYLALLWPGVGLLWSVVEVFRRVYRFANGELPGATLWQVVLPGLYWLAIVAGVLAIGSLVISGLVESATERYATTGKVRSLFDIWRNLEFAWGDFYDVVRIEVSMFLVWLGIALASLLLWLTVGGTIFIPTVMVPFYMWTRGSLMGQWIWKNRMEGEAPA